MQKRLSILIIGILIALGGIYLYKKYKVAPQINFSSLPLIQLNGKPFNFGDLKGKKTMVCFSASWCPNCINEMNSLKKIMDKELNDVSIIIVSDEPLETVIEFKEKRQYPFFFLKLNKGFNDVNVFSIPVTYFFDKSLQLKKEEVGEINWNDPSTREYFKQAME